MSAAPAAAPLDHYRPIPVIASLKELEKWLVSYHTCPPPPDYVSFSQAQVNLTPAQRDETVQLFKQRLQNEKALVKALTSGQTLTSKVTKKTKTIITPGYSALPAEKLYKREHFEYSEHYVRSCVHRGHVQQLRLSRGDSITYDIQLEDLKFLETIDENVPLALEETFLKLINQLESNTGFGPVIPFELGLGIAQSIEGVDLSYSVVRAIYDYWIRRRTQLQKPLLREFWSAPPSNLPLSFYVFQTRTAQRDRMSLRRPRRSLQEAAKRCELVVMDLNRVDKILKQIVKRDKQKLLIAELNGCIFEQMRRETRDSTYINPYWQYLKRQKFDKILNSTDALTNIDRWLENLENAPLPAEPTSDAGNGKWLPSQRVPGPPSQRPSVYRLREDNGFLWADELGLDGYCSHAEMLLLPRENRRSRSSVGRFALLHDPPGCVDMAPPLASLTGSLASERMSSYMHTLHQCRLLHSLVRLTSLKI